MLSNQQAHFTDLYNAFFAFYQEALAGDIPPYEKVRLVLTTRFFDDAKLQKTVIPLFDKFPSNVEDKRAAACAAYFDALTIHNRTVGLNFVNVSEKERRVK